MLQASRQTDLILLTVLLTPDCPQTSIAVHPIKEKSPITGGFPTLGYPLYRTHNSSRAFIPSLPQSSGVIKCLFHRGKGMMSMRLNHPESSQIFWSVYKGGAKNSPPFRTDGFWHAQNFPENHFANGSTIVPPALSHCPDER